MMVIAYKNPLVQNTHIHTMVRVLNNSGHMQPLMCPRHLGFIKRLQRIQIARSNSFVWNMLPSSLALMHVFVCLE